MPKTCSLCLHPNRFQIDRALVNGTPFRNVSAQFGTSIASLSRHRSHISTAIEKATEKREEQLGDNLLAEARRVRAESVRLARKAEEEGDLRAALLAHKLALDSNDSLAKLLEKSGEGDAFRVEIVEVGAPPDVCPNCGKRTA